MFTIEIYIDTCEDQTASTPTNGKDERPHREKKDGNRHRLKEAFFIWRDSIEERHLRILEFYNGR